MLSRNNNFINRDSGLTDDEIRQSLVEGLSEFAQGEHGQPRPLPGLPVAQAPITESAVTHERIPQKESVAVAQAAGSGSLPSFTAIMVYNGGAGDVKLYGEIL